MLGFMLIQVVKNALGMTTTHLVERGKADSSVSRASLRRLLRAIAVAKD